VENAEKHVLLSHTCAHMVDVVPAKPHPAPHPSAPAPTTSSALPGDVPGWTRIFADDFDTDAPVGSFPSTYTNWGAYDDGWSDTSKNGEYYPSTVLSASGGNLQMYIHTANGIHMVCAPYPLLPGASAANGMLHGMYRARMRVDPLVGYKTAWLLWPDSEVWPQDGEVDFPEANLDSTIDGFVHHMNATSGSDQSYWLTGVTYANAWHEVTITRLPNSITFTLDDKSWSTTDRVPSLSMHWVLQTETQLSGGPPADNVAGYLLVDWVAVYAPTAALLAEHAVANSAAKSTSSASSHVPSVAIVLPVVALAVVVSVVLLVALVVVLRNRRARHAQLREQLLAASQPVPQ